MRITLTVEDDDGKIATLRSKGPVRAYELRLTERRPSTHTNLFEACRVLSHSPAPWELSLKCTMHPDEDTG